jgi:hypothetical protein
MIAARIPPTEGLTRVWNSTAMRHGRIQGEHHSVDLGAVIPGSLAHGDIADIVSLLAGRKVLYADAKDRDVPDLAALRARFAGVAAGSGTSYEPGREFTAERLLGWLGAE